MDRSEGGGGDVSGRARSVAAWVETLGAAQRIAAVGSWTWDPGNDLPAWSDQLYRLYGLEPGDPIPPYAESARQYTPESWRRLTEAVERCVRTGEPYDVDVTLAWPDGSFHEANARGEAVRDASGAIVVLRGTVADITERRHAEERSRRLLQNSPLNGVIYRFVRDDDGAIVDLVIEDLNDLAATALGGSVADLMGRSALDLMGEALLPYLDIAREVDRTGESQTFETHFDWNDRDYLAVVFLVGDDRYANLNLDTTDLKRAQRAAHASESRYAELVEKLPVGVYTCRQDPDGNVAYTFVSEQMGRITGIDPLILLADSINSALTCHPDDLAGFAQSKMDSVVHTDQPYRWEGRFVVDGEVRWVRVEAEAAPTGDGWWTWHGFVEDVTERRRAQEAMRESEELYRSIVAASPDDITITDLTGAIRFVSPRGVRMLGLGSVEDAIGRNLGDYIVPEDRGRAGAAVRARMAGEPVGAEVYRGMHVDGTLFDIEVNGEILRAPDGTASGLVYVARDVTDRVQSEEALRASEERYRLLAESVSDQIVVLDRDLRYASWNREAERATGIPAELALGRTPAELFGELADNEVVRAVQRVLETGEARTVIQDLVDGESVRTFEVSLYPFRDGVTVLSRDVTERIRQERAIRASADLYRGVVEAVADGVIVHGPDGSTIAMNARAEAILGVGLDGLVGRQVDDPRWAFTREDGTPLPAEAHPALIALQTGRATGDVVMTVTRPDGARVLLSIRAEPLVGPDGTIGGAVVSFADVTEIRQVERGIREARKLEAIGRLAGGIAHDFNNLLTAIAGSAEMLADSIPPDDPRRTDVDEIRRASARAAGLTRQLLAFGRRQVLRPSDLSVDEVVADLETMLKRTLGEHIALEVVAPPTPCRARVDRVQLEQVIVNLALNARDAMPAGGTLTIETSLAGDDGAPIAPGSPYVARWVRLIVADTGLGMDEETISHIFEPFFSTKSADRGTGLGLATVDGIVAQSGGRIDVMSVPGSGTEFAVLLPAADGGGEAAGPAPASASHGGPDRPRGSITILLAEDDTAVRVFTRRVLRERGYRVLEASSGDEALRLADAFPDRIDLLVTDVLMPGLSGPDLARELVQLRPGVRTLFVSGFTPESVLPAGAARDSAFLAKPFSRAELLARVAEAIHTDDGPGAPADPAEA